MSKEYSIEMALLDPNIYSRPQSKMKDIRGLCIHWVGNAKSRAIANRNYFNNLPSNNKNLISQGKSPIYASSHEIIGLDGEVVICVPKNEVTFHAGAKKYKTRVGQLLNNSPNRHLYGIETCHPDWDGKFNNKTYNTLINRSADLLIEFNLRPSKDTIWRHFDVTGKDCPKYYVGNNSQWDILINDITKSYNKKINIKGEDIVKFEQKWQSDQLIETLESLGKKGLLNSSNDWIKKFKGGRLTNSEIGLISLSVLDRVTNK